MKKIFWCLLIFIPCTVSLQAQKARVRSAYTYYKEPYQEYDKAKAAIDEAVQNEQTKGLAEAWYYRGLIYTSLYKNEKYSSLCGCLQTAYESFHRAVQIDPENEWADEIRTFRIPNVLQFLFGEGVSVFNRGDYPGSLRVFEFVSEALPNDTAAKLNCAYAAEKAGDTAKMKKYFRQLASLNYLNDNVYISLSGILKQEKDTSGALHAIRTGRNLMPDSLSLILAEINLLLSSGKRKEAIESLQLAIRKDPGNISLYLALGSTYDILANPKTESGEDLPKPPEFEEYVSKAEEAYKKGLLASPDNYEINFNLGALYFNRAAEMANASAKISSNIEFQKAKNAYEAKFRQAQPYLEKALQVNPGDAGTLVSLKQLYARTGQMEKYNEIKTKLDHIEKK